MIYFVRHGKTDWNELDIIIGHKDVMLNNNGIEEINDLSNILSSFNIDRIISSDLARAKQTAEIISKKINTDIIYDSRLRGYDYGLLEGHHRYNIKSCTWNVFRKYPEIFNAESNEDFYNRIKNFFEQLDFSKDTIIVTHGGSIRMILYYLDNRNKYDDKLFNDYEKKITINHGEYFMFDGENIIYQKNKTKTLH